MQDSKEKRLNYVTYYVADDAKCSKLLAVTAYWNELTATFNFYFDGTPTDDEVEIASDIATEVICQFAGDFLLEEHYIAWDQSKPVPEENIAYKREEGWKPPSLR